jgi:hypothetical protein
MIEIDSGIFVFNPAIESKIIQVSFFLLRWTKSIEAKCDTHLVNTFNYTGTTDPPTNASMGSCMTPCIKRQRQFCSGHKNLL